MPQNHQESSDLLQRNQELMDLLEQLYNAASKLDIAYIHAITHEGESSFTGEEYEDLMEPLEKAEELLGID